MSGFTSSLRSAPLPSHSRIRHAIPVGVPGAPTPHYGAPVDPPVATIMPEPPAVSYDADVTLAPPPAAADLAAQDLAATAREAGVQTSVSRFYQTALPQDTE